MTLFHMCFIQISDCQEPVFGYNTQIIGGNYHVGSVVTVQCRSGYEQIDGTGGVEKTCKEIVGWIGKTLLCRGAFIHY